MAEVILFRPDGGYTNKLGSRRSPLGLMHIAAPLVKRGISVAIIDALIEPNWREKLEAQLGEETICVGASVMTGPTIRVSLEFSQAVKRLNPVPVIWGGMHPSMLPQHTIEHDLVDMLIEGEGEESFPQLVEALRSSGDLDAVPGLYYKSDGQIRRSPVEARRLDLDSQPPPDYDMIDTENYIPQRQRNLGYCDRSLELYTDRGCPHRCAFCYNLHHNKRRWRALSADVVLDRLEALVRRYDLGGVTFVSDNFFVDKNRVTAVCQGILDRSLDIAWHADIRVDSFLRLDDDLVELMFRSGCTCLTFGVESGSDRMLSLINKDITVDQVKRAHQRALKRGFLVNYHFMLGLPDETEQDVLQTLDLMSYLGRDPEAVIYGPSVYTPYPGTPLFKRVLELGLEPPQTLEDWISSDWAGVDLYPWISASHRDFIDEAVQLARAAFGEAWRSSAAGRLLRSYARLRYLGFRRGLRLGTVDGKLARLAQSTLRRAKSAMP